MAAFSEQIERMNEWTAGKTPGPWWLVLFPTMRCNLRCSMCWGPWKAVDFPETPDARLLALVDEAADLGVRQWTMVGGGEPMVRGDLLMKICAQVRRRGMFGELFTNGTLFNDRTVEHLIDIGWNSVRVSLDGPTAAINDSVRSKGSFEKATAGLRLFAQYKAARGSGLPTTGLHTTLTCANAGHLEEMVMLAGDLGCDGEFALSGLIVHDEFSRQFALTEAQKAALPECLERAAKRAEQTHLPNNLDTFLPEYQAAMTHPAEALVSAPALTGIYDAQCYDPWLSVAVTAEGNVGPCCAFTADNADNINAMSLAEAWTGPYMQRLRKQMVEGRLPRYCRQCPYNLQVRARFIRAELLSHDAPCTRREESAAQLAARLTRSTLTHLRAEGMGKTVQRAVEWVKTRRR